MKKKPTEKKKYSVMTWEEEHKMLTEIAAKAGIHVPIVKGDNSSAGKTVTFLVKKKE